MEILVELGTLARQPNSDWALTTFIILKKNKSVRFLINFREVHKCVIHKPYPIPKISPVLQELSGFNYTTTLDLITGYYTLGLDGYI